MSEARDSMGPRPSITHDSTTGQLLKHNREIAQVREQLDKMGKRLKTGQARNAVLLEESSELDSEVSRQLQRYAESAESLREVEGRARLEDEAQATQEAKHAEALGALAEKMEAKMERRRVGEAELSTEALLAVPVAAEIAGLREALQERGASLAEARRSREEYVSSRTRRSVGAGPSQAARQAADAEREAIDTQCDVARAEERVGRQQVSELQAELLAESRRRDELKSRLREEETEQSGRSGRLKELEAAVAARGGDASAILAEVRAEYSESPDAAADDSIAHQTSKSSVLSKSSLIGDEVIRVRSTSVVLREDLQKVQEMKSSLDKALSTLQVEADEDSTTLQTQLDDARSELQRSLRETANRNASEVSQLESEVQHQRQLAAFEMLTEQDCAERIAELKSTRRDAQERAHAASQTRRQSQVAEAARSSTLSNEISTVRAEMIAAEDRLMASSRRLADAEARRVNVHTEGGLRVAKARRMIEDLWREIRTQSALVEANRSSPQRALVVPGVLRR